MTEGWPAITGIGSVSPYDAVAGLISRRKLEPSPIGSWPTAGVRRAFLVPPFRPATVVPGLKTRRLDRLSMWALVASTLAMQDAGIDLRQVDRYRVAVVFGTGFGCVELTEAFYRSATEHGWSATDPITFPETLTNAPASHVSLFHDLRGPNITVSCRRFASECALLHASSLLRHEQADLAIVVAGDVLTRAVYEWYEAANLLSPVCFDSEASPQADGFIPSEGVAAVVLEPAGRQGMHCYAHLRAGRWAASGQPAEAVRQMLAGCVPDIAVCTANGAPCNGNDPASVARQIIGNGGTIVPPQAVPAGLVETGGLFHLILALSSQPGSGQLLLLGTSGPKGFAALHLELP